jgi:cell wall-associated NlpC family hydrolase
MTKSPEERRRTPSVGRRARTSRLPALACGLGLALATWVSTGCAPVAARSRPLHPLSLREDDDRAPASARAARPGLLDDAVPDDHGDDVRARIAAAAAATIGDRPLVVGGVRYRFDCSGVAAAIYARAGVPLLHDGRPPDTKALFAAVQKNGSLRRQRPLPGDLVFFDDTWDENGNGRVDDPLSHVGVVERSLDDGTVVFVQRAGGRVIRSRLNLARPHDRVDEQGRSLNHWLRAAHGAHAAKTTGELFVAFGTLAVTPQGTRAGVLARR